MRCGCWWPPSASTPPAFARRRTATGPGAGESRVRNSPPIVMFSSLETVGQFTYLAFQCLRALPGACLRPRELGRQLHSVLVGAMPLAAVAGIALGVVIWMHSHRLL